MASVTLRGIRKRHDAATETIGGVDLEVRDGEFIVFVGPSGCGKTTLLRIIAGLESISGGELRIGGKRANELPPPKRGVAMVFQNYALYPHMTVAQNMGFSLKMAKIPKAQAAEQIARAASILKIEHLLDRMPKALSGGQRQRVAIGRAIVRRPGVFLFDEPLSNLDAALRVQMRAELTNLHKELGSTMIYVTHDQIEAMTMGDRIAVFNAGRIEQVGTPAEIYGTPTTTFVARFLGSPPMNILAGRVRGQGANAVLEADHLGSLPVSLPETIDAAAATQFGVRPERWEFSPTRGWPVRVDLVERLGDQILIYLQAAGLDAPICTKISAVDTALKTGTSICIAPAPGALHFFNAEGRRLGAIQP